MNLLYVCIQSLKMKRNLQRQTKSYGMTSAIAHLRKYLAIDQFYNIQQFDRRYARNQYILCINPFESHTNGPLLYWLGRSRTAGTKIKIIK